MRRPQLLPGANLVETQQILDRCRTAGLDVRGRVSRPDQLLADYLSWCRSSADQLARVLHPRDIDRLLLTATYWTLLNAQSAGEIVTTAVHAEIDARTRDLEAAAFNLDQDRVRWTQGFGPLVVLDTCVFIEHKDEFPASLASIERRVRSDQEDGVFATGTPVQFVIPLQVIDELDKAKADRSRGRAQLTLARLNELITAPSEPTKVDGLRDGSYLHLLLDEWAGSTRSASLPAASVRSTRYTNGSRPGARTYSSTSTTNPSDVSFSPVLHSASSTPMAKRPRSRPTWVRQLSVSTRTWCSSG